MMIIPLRPIAAQQVPVQLGGQACLINVQQKGVFLFLDLTSNGQSVVSGVIGENANRMVRDAYLGFSGDLSWLDTEGSQDPDFTGLGSRYFLAWLAPEDLAALIAEGEA